jgi:hypothetical protein
MKGADRKRWNKLTVAKRQGGGCEAVAERSRRQRPDRRNTKRQRGRVRATSVLLNAKSQDHQGASSRAARPGLKVHVLTQGGLTCRAGQESAEAIVAMKPRESAEEPRAEGINAKRLKEPVSRAKQVHPSAAHSAAGATRCANPNAWMVQPSVSVWRGHSGRHAILAQPSQQCRSQQ